MKRRLLPILMTLVLVCALPIWAAFVTSGDVTNPLVCTAGATSSEESAVEKLKLAISRGVDAQLTEDIEITQTLYVERSMTLDLNGHVLKMTGDGSVLYVKKDGSDTVALTITDSRPQNPHGSYAGLPAGGVITGGTGTRESWTQYNTFGGAVFLEKDTTLKLEGGTLTGNSGSSIYIDGATFVMSGGTITGEAVGVHNNVGTFTMAGGRITGCSEKGVYMYNGNMTMSGTAYIGGNGTNQYQYIETADIYVHEPVRKETGLSVTGGIIEGKVYIFFETSDMGSNDNDNEKALKNVAESVVKESGVLDGHIRVKMKDGAGTAVDYNTVNFIDEVAKTRTFQPIFVKGDKKARKPDDPDTVNGQAFMYWAAKGASEAWDFNTPLEVPLTLYAVRTPASSGGYYYYPTTDTKTDDAKGSPKTADPGVALYAALSILSLTGLTCTGRKKF